MTIKLCDITALDCDCIVNAANPTLLGGGGVDGAIHRAAGPQLLEECRGLNGCRTGEAKLTKGYRLRAKYVIHTVGPVYSGSEQDPQKLNDCYQNCLDLARDNGIHSIAFPAISTGVYGYPMKPAAEIAIRTVCRWLREHAGYEMKVIFSCFHQSALDIYRAVYSEIAEASAAAKTPLGQWSLSTLV